MKFSKPCIELLRLAYFRDVYFGERGTLTTGAPSTSRGLLATETVWHYGDSFAGSIDDSAWEVEP